jgi:DNA polymerase IV
MHIDFNSYFATVEQQANPRLRGKPIGVTGGDRLKRTVLGAASIEAKRYGVKTGMQIWEARRLCPEIILVKGDSDKYLETTKRFLNILGSYSPYLEVFSIDEVFLCLDYFDLSTSVNLINQQNSPSRSESVKVAIDIKRRIKVEIGEWITCSIGISYNKLMAKLAGSLYKPDGLVMIENEQAAKFILDRVELDDICGIGDRIKKRLNNMGVFNFKQLRKVPLTALLASFKSYGQILYNMARGIDHTPVIPFYKRQEVKSIGHRHTIDHDTNNSAEIKQILLKLTELVARRLRAKKLVGKTVHCWYRSSLERTGANVIHLEGGLSWHPLFQGNSIQITISYINDGLDIFKASWKIFQKIWDMGRIRMIGVSISNLKPQNPQNLSFLPESKRQETIIKTLDKINDKYGEFTLQRGILLNTSEMKRKPNPFLSDRRFEITNL